VHKFEGLSAGPVDEGKIPNATPVIICDPDKQLVEGQATGFFYTMISSATTFGDDDGLNSAISFTGSDLIRDQIQRLTLKTNTNVTLVNVARQTAWVSYLERNIVETSSITDKMLADLIKWADEKVHYDVFYKRCLECEAVSMDAFSTKTLNIP
jgi:hypothetical protein